MTRSALFFVPVFTATFALSAAAQTISVGVPAQQGSVDGTGIMSDEFIWQQMMAFAAPVVPGQRNPVVFETWASDADTFTENPVWPDPTDAKKLQASLLAAQKNPGHGPIDVPCKPPPGAATGNFPNTGCIAEETKRNKPQFDYIVQYNLHTAAGLAEAHAKDFNVQMPITSLSVKGDWVPVDDMLEWLPQLGDLDGLRAQYYTNTSDGTEYALASIHVSSKQNPNWVWGSFENQNNPGRCDYMGCWDMFGAAQPAVPPNLREKNGGYGACAKTDALTAMMETAGLDAVWGNYCLKATMVDYNAADGTPYILGNSVIEGIVGNGTVAASSCIACHVYASFDAKGVPGGAALNMLPFNPTGAPLDQPLIGSAKYDFMWGVVNLLD